VKGHYIFALFSQKRGSSSPNHGCLCAPLTNQKAF